MLRNLLALLAFLIIKLICSLLRYKYVNRHHSVLAIEQGNTVLYAFFHGKQLMLLGYPVPKPMVQMVSLSDDGDLQAGILRHLRFTVVRGSSGKGGRDALFNMTELVLSGCHAALAVDGSRGPNEIVKSGIIHLARDTDSVIIPLAAVTDKKIVLEKAWDKYVIPLPFSKTVVMEGEPISVDAEIEDDEIELTRQKLEDSLVQLHIDAEERLKKETEIKETEDDEKYL